MLKNQQNLDVTVDVTAATRPDGMIEVGAKVGVNEFSWTVDYANKRYTVNGELTQKFMQVLQSVQQ